MTKKHQQYSPEFKAEAVRTVLEKGLSVSEGADVSLRPGKSLYQQRIQTVTVAVQN